MKVMNVVLAAALVFAGAPAMAQTRSDTLIVMTVPLKHLSAIDAVKLLQPFVTTLPFEGKVGGGVFPVPNGSAVTIREKLTNYARMLQLLREYDRSASTVSFTFQLIIADNSGKRDPDIASLDTLLRSVLKYTGYNLTGVGVLRASENSVASETIAGKDQKFSLQITVSNVQTTRADGPKIIVDGVVQESAVKQEGSVKLMVDLRRMQDGVSGEFLLGTGVTVPIGQTVVLGSAALDNGRAIILTVRPQLVPAQPRARED